MASQRDIRRRIGAVKNIKQITRAMQFVAASKLKRAQDATLSARPYSEKLDEVLADLAAVLGGEDHPLLAEREEGGKRLIVLVTTDRGLAGPLNTNTIRFAAREITGNSGDLAVVTVGRKGRDAMRRAGVPMEAHFAGFGDRPAFADVLPLARLITDDFLAGTYARVDVIYNRFVSTLVQRPEMIQLLPIRATEDTEGIPGNQFIFEPNPARRAGAARAALRRDAPVPGRARGQGQRGIQPDGRDEERDRERRGPHRGPDPLVQQGPSVQHHPRDDRDRVRRERSLTHRTQEATHTMAIAATNATGRVIQITGPVVDIEFPAGQLPAIFNAVEIQREGQDSLVCEVQQHLGNNWVRSVAMTTTDGLARGIAGARHRRADHGAGRRGDARSRVRRARPAHRQQGPGQRRDVAADPPRGARPSTSSRPRSRSSRPASRSST